VLLLEELLCFFHLLVSSLLLLKFDLVNLRVQNGLPVLDVEEIRDRVRQSVLTLREPVDHHIPCIAKSNLLEDDGSLSDNEHWPLRLFVVVPALLAALLLRVLADEADVGVEPLDVGPQLHEVEVVRDDHDGVAAVLLAALIQRSPNLFGEEVEPGGVSVLERADVRQPPQGGLHVVSIAYVLDPASMQLGKGDGAHHVLVAILLVDELEVGALELLDYDVLSQVFSHLHLRVVSIRVLNTVDVVELTQLLRMFVNHLQEFFEMLGVLEGECFCLVQY